MGPGATGAENRVTVALALAAGAAAPAVLDDGTGGQRILAAAIAVDLVPGVWVMATPAGRRWWHRPAWPGWMPLAVVLAHVHPLVLAWAFPERSSWAWGGAMYGGAVLTLGLLGVVPSRLRLAVALVAAALLLGLGAKLGGDPLGWFSGAYLLKLIVAFGGGGRRDPARSAPSTGSAT